MPTSRAPHALHPAAPRTSARPAHPVVRQGGRPWSVSLTPSSPEPLRLSRLSAEGHTITPAMFLATIADVAERQQARAHYVPLVDAGLRRAAEEQVVWTPELEALCLATYAGTFHESHEVLEAALTPVGDWLAAADEATIDAWLTAEADQWHAAFWRACVLARLPLTTPVQRAFLRGYLADGHIDYSRLALPALQNPALTTALLDEVFVPLARAGCRAVGQLRHHWRPVSPLVRPALEALAKADLAVAAEILPDDLIVSVRRAAWKRHLPALVQKVEQQGGSKHFWERLLRGAAPHNLAPIAAQLLAHAPRVLEAQALVGLLPPSEGRVAMAWLDSLPFQDHAFRDPAIAAPLLRWAAEQWDGPRWSGWWRRDGSEFVVADVLDAAPTLCCDVPRIRATLLQRLRRRTVASADLTLSALRCSLATDDAELLTAGVTHLNGLLATGGNVAAQAARLLDHLLADYAAQTSLADRVQVWQRIGEACGFDTPVAVAVAAGFPAMPRQAETRAARRLS